MYFGSVRFFKHMILLTIIILILVPTGFAIRFGFALRGSQIQVDELGAEIAQIRQEMDAHIEEEIIREEQEEERLQAVFSADGPYYQALYPDFYAPQPLSVGEAEENVVYLTFDDGPTQNTDAVLEILKEQNVKATFFVIGTTGSMAGERMRAIVEQGHTLGMHSYSHDFDTIYGSVELFLTDMYEIFQKIREETGTTPTVFRFPGGSINAYNPGLYEEMIAEMLRRGFVPHDWNISVQDATTQILSPSRIVENATINAEGRIRAFILMHDGARQVTTVEALPAIIERYRALGFQFNSISPETKPILFGYLKNRD